MKAEQEPERPGFYVATNHAMTGHGRSSRSIKFLNVFEGSKRKSKVTSIMVAEYPGGQRRPNESGGEKNPEKESRRDGARSRTKKQARIARRGASAGGPEDRVVKNRKFKDEGKCERDQKCSASCGEMDRG